jgi:hypothetical protein
MKKQFYFHLYKMKTKRQLNLKGIPTFIKIIFTNVKKMHNKKYKKNHNVFYILKNMRP